MWFLRDIDDADNDATDYDNAKAIAIPGFFSGNSRPKIATN